MHSSVKSGEQGRTQLARIIEKIIRPFSIPFELPYARGNIEVVRLIFGVLLMSRYLSMATVSIADGDPVRFEAQAAIAFGFSAMIAAGLLTPLALLGILIYFVTPILGVYLGTQVGVIVIWGLLLFGAGKRFSVDAVLTSSFPAFFRRLYCFSPALDSKSVGTIRFVLLVMFYGINLAAMSFHLTDPLWVRLTLLQFIFTMPLVTPFYQEFTALRESVPVLYDLFCSSALFVQSFWELFTLPLMYFRIGRLFVAIQSLAFFVAAQVFFQLGYLPAMEICWWMLVFNYSAVWRDAVGAGRADEQQLDRTENIWAALSGRKVLTAVTIGTCLIALDFAVVSAKIFMGWTSAHDVLFQLDPNASMQLSGLRQPRLYYLFAQGPAEIFSSSSLRTLDTYFVAYELDSANEPKRIVPMVAHDGSRMLYFRNDYLLFDRTAKYVLTRHAGWDQTTLNSVNRLVDLHVCLSGAGKGNGETSSSFEAMLLRRELLEHRGYLKWGPPEPLSTQRIDVDSRRLQQIRRHCGAVWGVLPRRIVHFGLRKEWPPADDVLAAVKRLRQQIGSKPPSDFPINPNQ